jgi:hypothetical protein
MYKRAGFIEVRNGTPVEVGRNNMVIGVTCKNDPQKIRGKRGDNIFFEEAGKFPGLLEAWEIAKPSVEAGSFAVGTLIAYGTGGTDEANYESLEKLFYNPDAYGCIPLNNIWDEGASGKKCGYFAPAFQNWEGHMDRDGNSHNEGAKEYLQSERDKRKKAKDARALEQYICENPFTPQEATLNSNANLFPIAELIQQLNHIESTQLYKNVQYGILLDTQDGIKFQPRPDVYPILEYPTPKGNTDGAVGILEMPIKINNEVPKGLYIIGHDPYAHDRTSGDSLGACYVMKMTNNFSHTYNDCIVASYVGRPHTQDEFNRIMFMLAMLYNARIGFENDRGNVIPYATNRRLLHYLATEFQLLNKKQLQSQLVRRNFGMHMTDRRKEQGEVYIRDWLNTIVSHYDDGNPIKNLHLILLPDLLQELIKFNDDGNFDRVMALMICMYHMQELRTARIVPQHKVPHDDFFNRQFFQ